MKKWLWLLHNKYYYRRNFVRLLRKDKLPHAGNALHQLEQEREVEFAEDFREHDKSRWKVVGRKEYGSARPDSLHVFTEDNVSFGREGLSIRSKYEGRGVDGLDWDGNVVLSRKASSGMVQSIEAFKPEGRFSALCYYDGGHGCWGAFWLLKVKDDQTNYSDTASYEEIDGFELMGLGDDKMQISLHRGTKEDRNLFSISYPFWPRKAFLLCIEFEDRYVNILINDILVMRTPINKPKGRMMVIFSDGVSDFDGRVDYFKIMGRLYNSGNLLNVIRFVKFK